MNFIIATVLTIIVSLLGFFLHDRRSRKIADVIAQNCARQSTGCILLSGTKSPHLLGGFWRNWTPSFVWAVAIVFACLEVFWIVATPDSPVALERIHLDAALAIAGFCGVVFLGYILSRHDLPLYVWLLVGSGIIFLIALFGVSAWTIPRWAHAKTEPWSWADRPGTGFAFVLGFITITGFILTISQLHETNIRITDYTNLLRRLQRLLIEAHTWQSHGKNGTIWAKVCRVIDKIRDLDAGIEPIRIYVRTLALGSMSTDVDIFARYGTALEDIQCESSKWVLIQLKHDDLPVLDPGAYSDDEVAAVAALSQQIGACDAGKLFLGFLKRQFPVTKIVAGCNEARRLAALFSRHQCPGKRVILDRPIQDSDLPDYSLFVTGRRAIVVTTLDMPIGEKPKPRGIGPVHVVAVETTSRQVIGELIKTFDSIAEACSVKQSSAGTV